MKNVIGQMGDTIVEVLIAVAVVSLILTGAYAIANRSLINIRQSQERTEALNIATQQVERLKVRAELGADATGDKVFTTLKNPFCIWEKPIEQGLYVKQSIKTGKIQPDCTQNNGIDYYITITRTDNADNFQHLFSVRVYWHSLSRSGGDDQVIYNYQLNQCTNAAGC